MAFYKLNKFHFHLTDDEGWRLEIEKLPELTEIGSRRGHTLDETDRLVPSFGSGPYPEGSTGTGFYSREDFIEILRFAHRRHIEVIPEIDTPGHARAAIISMENRYRKLIARGEEEAAREFLLSDLSDESVYRSVQGWRDNVINVCRGSSYRFLETVVDEIIKLYREAEAPLTAIHTGGDEFPSGAWTRSPICRSAIEANELEGVNEIADLSQYFVRQFNEILVKRNLITAGWEEIALQERFQSSVKNPNPNLIGGDFQLYVWNSVWGWGGEENAYKLANSGYPVILCNASNLYFDLAYEKHPEEPGYYWAGFVDTRKPFEFSPFNLYYSSRYDLMGSPLSLQKIQSAVRLSPEGTTQILGIQGQLWSENAKSPEILEYLVFPKLLSLAERAWSPRPSWADLQDFEKRDLAVARDWNRFANALGQRELTRLCYLMGGVAFRIPPPGAAIRDGKLEANIAFPGLVIRYTTDGSGPVENSAIYPGPIDVSGTIKLRAFDSRGRGSRVTALTR
jgi:hexosaminidase